MTPGWSLRYAAICAGRKYGSGLKGARQRDFSDTDYKLALNLGVPFAVPEVFFKQWKDKVHNDLPAPLPVTKLSTCPGPSVPMDLAVYSGGEPAREIVLLVGAAGSGKSTFAHALIETNRANGREYLYINQDTIAGGRPGKFQQCLAVAEGSLGAKPALSVVVDNTNIDPKTRAQWIGFASNHGLRVRAVILDTPPEVCKLQVLYRLYCPSTPAHDKREIPPIVLSTHFKNLRAKTEKGNGQAPTVEEGFARVDEVAWQGPAAKHEDAASRLLFDLYLL